MASEASTSSNSSARSRVIMRLGGNSMRYPYGQTPLQSPHCRHRRIRSPSLDSYSLPKKASLVDATGGLPALKAKVHLPGLAYASKAETLRTTDGRPALNKSWPAPKRGHSVPFRLLHRANQIGSGASTIAALEGPQPRDGWG